MKQIQRAWLLLIIFQQAAGLGEKKYLIDQIIINKKLLTVIPNAHFKQQYLFGNFKAEYESLENIEDIPEEIISIPFILSTISLVWESGQIYYVKKMDRNLFRSLDTIKKVFKVFYPQLRWDGQLLADKLVNCNNAAIDRDEELIGLVFSGGVDSTFSSLVYHGKNQLLLTYLGFSEEMQSHTWDIICKQCTSFSQEYGNRENVFIRSNFRKVLKCHLLHRKYPTMDSWREFCQESLSLTGLAAPVLWKKGCQKFIISSSWDWQFPYPWGSHPFIDNNIQFAKTRVENCCYEVNRQAKLRFIADFCKENNLNHPIYHVCRAGFYATNCNKCEKCLRTINGLIVEEEDLAKYGFHIDRRQAYKLTKAQFCGKTTFPRFTHAVCHIWQSIASRAQKRLIEEEIDNEELKEYLVWLSSVDFTKHINLKQFRHNLDFKHYMHFLPCKA